MTEFRLFLSYKEFDGDAVIKVKDLLENFSLKHLKIKPPDFHVFLARDSIGYGQVYRDEIYQRLSEAHGFVLFRTTPNADWDWCMYEGGVYEAAARANGRDPSIIAILSTRNATPPAPLRNLQVCFAEHEQIKRYLVQTIIDKVGLAQPDPGIDSSLQKDIGSLCDAIISVFAPYIKLDDQRFLAKGRVFLPTITIRCKIRNVCDEASFFQDAEVTLSAVAAAILRSADELSLQDFFKLETVKDPWINAIKESLLNAVQTAAAISPWKIVIAGHIGDNPIRHLYRPVLTYAYPEDAHIHFEIRLIELLDDPNKYTPNLNRLFRILKLCHSYRAQLVEALREMNPQWAPKGFFEVQRALENLRVLTDQYGHDDGLNPIRDLPEHDELVTAAEHFQRLETALDLCVRCADNCVPADDLFEVIRIGVNRVNSLWLHVIAEAYSNKVSQYKEASPVDWGKLDELLQLQLDAYEKQLADATVASSRGEHEIAGQA